MLMGFKVSLPAGAGHFFPAAETKKLWCKTQLPGLTRAIARMEKNSSGSSLGMDLASALLVPADCTFVFHFWLALLLLLTMFNKPDSGMAVKSRGNNNGGTAGDKITLQQRTFASRFPSVRPMQ